MLTFEVVFFYRPGSGVKKRAEAVARHVSEFATAQEVARSHCFIILSCDLWVELTAFQKEVLFTLKEQYVINCWSVKKK